MLRILLIDDNPYDRLLAIRTLEREFSPVQVKQAIKAEEFASILEAGQFDLAITDYQLRWSDGLTVLQAIKARYPDRPVIMFTNSTTQEEAVEAMKSGLDDYVVKSPQHYIRLAAAARSALEQTATRQRAATLETRLQTLLNQLDVGVYRSTLDGSLLEANPAFMRLLGLNALTEIQVGESLAPYFAPEDYAQLNQLQQNQHSEQEVQLRRIDGRLIWVRLSQTFSTVDGKMIIDGLMEDITPRKQLEQQLRQQAEALEQANRVKDEFLAVLSHELRSPLNAILGWAKLLQKQKYDEATTARALATIERNAALQTQLIEDLLDVSRIMQGKLTLNVKSVNLVSVIEATIENMCLAAEAKSIQVEFFVDAAVQPVAGDPIRLQQIIWNLLSNAVKFTPNNGRVEIRLSKVSDREKQQTTDNYAQITVSDTGKGIRADFLPYVFDYFRQSDASITRSYGGLGLGLAIVRHLVELHGGTVSAKSPGEKLGATFTVTLPLHVQPETSDIVRSHSQAHNLTGIQVLVVDDEADSRELLTFVLEDCGAQVTATQSARQALAALEKATPDVLVSDIGMPGEDGYTLLCQVRSLKSKQREIPAIALTAYARDEDYSRAIAAGFQLHIPKPIDPATLIAAIANLTGRVG